MIASFGGIMDQVGETLPIRLAPRKRSQIFFLIFFGFFFVFSIIWMVGASQKGTRLKFNDVEVTDPKTRVLFPLFGIPFALIGACGLAVATLKVMPNSPCYYLDLSVEGLTLRTLLKQRSFAWRDLPPFETLRVVSKSDESTTTTFYAVAMEPARDGAKPREILRISASEYGVKNSEQSAIDLAARLNRLRDAALQQLRSGSHEPSAGSSPADRDAQASRTVIRMR